MTVVRFTDGEVAVDVSVGGARGVTGRQLEDAYLEDIRRLTLGLVQAKEGSLYIGPVELLRFGPARVTHDAVEWPIEGGIGARRAGGRFRLASADGRLVASVDRYRPMLPLPIYAVTQLPVHRLITRLFLLRVRGREPAPGIAASFADRRRAAAVDLAFCATLAGLIGKRRRLRVLLGITAGYHVACWTISGRTLGGLVTGQRVVSIDGSRPSLGQSAVRLLTTPFAWIGYRALHDELAGTDVVAD
jgi:RDD family